MRLTDIHVDRYGPLPRFAHECRGNFEVFYGPNESGKTLLLEAVLKLLEPDVDTVIPEVSRVAETPSGHVVVERNGAERKLGDETVLGDLVDLTPHHLRNVFVVRDSDLRLDAEHEFYDAVTQQIGDLHTNEIDAIQERLVDRGRLTSVGGRGLSRAGEFHEAKTVRNTASALAEEIRAYVTEVEETDIAAAEREFLRVTTELHQCERALETQEAADTWDRHDTLSRRLETFEKAIVQLDDEFTRSTLDALRQLDRDIDRAEAEIETLEQEQEELRAELTTLEDEHAEVEAERRPLEKRMEDVDAVERALDTFRNTRGESIGASRGMEFARYVALGGIGLGGVAAVLGSTIAGVLLAGIGAIAAGWFVLQHRRVSAAERERDELLQRAQDVGFEVATVDEIGPEIRTFRDGLASLSERRDDLAQQIGVTENLLHELEADLRETRDDRRTKREEKRERLEAVGVTDVDAYRDRVAANEALVQQREQAAQSLRDALGEPPDEQPTPEAPIEYWEGELAASVADVDESVTADEYDPDRLDELTEEHAELRDRRHELDERLRAHELQLRDFEDRVQEISARPFLDAPVALGSRSVEGLEAVARDLDALAARIERDADVAREVLDIFDGIESEEEQKITDLFGADSRATEVFTAVTDGRYTDVRYDAAEKVLQVQRDGRDVFTPRQLSHGTVEQLYLSARIGLAEQLLHAEPGFFIMDDPFLPADRTRLRDGFEVLRHLAADGWQILYFTAKDEVGVDLVDDHALPCRTLDPLD